ncbi:PREDICTED: putative phospholipase B-like 2 [Lepidothrix coronata]|uniref:Phospholipase B-like n=1 Tax=Lepidothrix coronata TaxID=321398 RepID=A0A6J0IJ98_9PASS|nr:PREDICTED: putative phospholipase B-like 2 [Lepidothrix coronata]
MAAPRALLAAAVLLSPLLSPLLSAGAAGAAPAPAPRNVSVLLEPGSGRLRVLPGRLPAAVAWASLDDRIPHVGWAFLEVTTNASYNDSLQAYAAGLAEAAVTEQLMYMHWMNTMVGYCGPFKYESEYCQKLRDYLEANLGWMEEQMGKGQDPEYWHQVRLALLQLKGLEDSYNRRLDFPRGRFTLAPFGFLLLQLGGDLEDLESALNRSSLQRVLGSGSCSALVKLLPGNRDLLVAHDTWNSYQSMLRLIKKYTLPFRASAGGKSQIPGSIQVFSSYPGTIFSADDFYILSSGLVALETTIGNNNPARWKYLDPRGSVLEWLRNIVANRLARSGPEWATVFRRFNSGTYNNQWMVVDYNAFTPGGASPSPGVLTVLEQIPGLVVEADLTELLYQQGYWASYNVPYFEEIFNASGNLELVRKYGDWFTYDKNPRAQIFRRNQTLVHDLDSMIRLMRSNNYLQDPLSRCRGCDPPQNAENAISARSDLNPPNGTYPFPALRQRCHGGTDMKVTSSGMVPSFGLVAASGPTWDDVPPFRWSTSPCSSLLHMGHPDLWTFPPVKVHWD